MNKNNLLVRISLIFSIILLVAAVAVGCGEKKNDTPREECTFSFTAVFADGSFEEHTITTTEKTVGDALIANGLIEGEDGAYGLYVKKVCGVVADYDVDRTYWALYVDGAYGTTGVEKLKCSDGLEVEFRVEK